MIGFTAYQMHTALNLHFGKSGYDYFKYNGKTRVTEESFNKSKFKWQYIGLEKKFDSLLLFYYNAFKQNNFHFTTPQYIFKCSRSKDLMPKEQILKNVGNDLTYLSSVYKIDKSDMFKTNNLYPDLYDQYKKNKISLETILLIDVYISSVFQKNLSNDIIAWPSIIDEMRKISPFLVELIDRDMFTELFTSLFLNNK